jgi:cytochrome bd-type quinol oxidase subunit 1
MSNQDSTVSVPDACFGADRFDRAVAAFATACVAVGGFFSIFCLAAFALSVMPS